VRYLVHVMAQLRESTPFLLPARRRSFNDTVAVPPMALRRNRFCCSQL
jgi:hypothetical protein